MKASDLMIGDLVKYDNKVCKVCTIEAQMLLLSFNGGERLTREDKIEPISLTTKILEKNGFKKCNEDTDGAIQYEFGSKNLGVDIWSPGGIIESYLLGVWNKWSDYTESYYMISEMPIHYVHELQRVLKLCKIDKTIEL